MNLDIARNGIGFKVELQQPNDFTRFHISTTDLCDEEVQRALAEDGAGWLDVDRDHCWVHLTFLVELARPASVLESWQNNFNKLLEFAARHEWLNTTGTMLRGHIIRL